MDGENNTLPGGHTEDPVPQGDIPHEFIGAQDDTLESSEASPSSNESSSDPSTDHQNQQVQDSSDNEQILVNHQTLSNILSTPIAPIEETYHTINKDTRSLIDSDSMEEEAREIEEETKQRNTAAFEQDPATGPVDVDSMLLPKQEDVTEQAAVALAAVAAAANANHKSPALAAKQARAAAQTFITTQDQTESHNLNVQKVPWSLVKSKLEQKLEEQGNSPILRLLCQEDNEAFLQYLLLLQYFEFTNTEEPTIARSKTATLACEQLIACLRKIEAAYDSLSAMLPMAMEKRDEWNEDMETPVVVPDLLPPCTTAHGDATHAFFKACLDDYCPTNNNDSDHGSDDDGNQNEKTQSIGENMDSSVTDSTEGNDASPVKSTSSFIGQKSPSVFSSMFKRGNQKGSFLTTIRKKTTTSTKGNGQNENNLQAGSDSSKGGNTQMRPGEYNVKIEREMLGLTVENVLERTVVRTVLHGGPAKKAGAKVGSLIVKVGNVETKNLTHFETIDELRQSQRPLQLLLRQVSDDALRCAREEMGRLIRGSGFGTIIDGGNEKKIPSEDEENAGRPLIGADLRIDAYTHMIRRRFAVSSPSKAKGKKDDALAKVSEKLIWILTLFVIGLVREADRLDTLLDTQTDPTASPRRNPHSQYQHTVKDYFDAAKSISKVLLDFSRKKIEGDGPVDGSKSVVGSVRQRGAETGGPARQRRGGGPQQIGGRGMGKQIVPVMPQKDNSSLTHEKPLLQIGDVLQRVRTFLADTTSPPAALLRAELIGFLCDVLDIDTDMELAAEESESATAGGETAAINDLGSAGSLLKLIILSCPIMRSPTCEVVSREPTGDVELQEELRRRFGHREAFSAVDLHRLHAGNRFLTVVHRLAASRSTSARITACSLGPVIWGHLDFPHQLQLRGVITRALHDVEVIVRKSTATILHEIAELVFDPRCVPWLVLMCERAMTDPEPQLRSAAMTLTWHLAEHLPNAFLGDASKGSRYLRRLPNRSDPIYADVYLLQCKLLPVATRLAEDRSPSVRLAVAAQCDRLCDALGDHWSSVIIDVLLALLSDLDDRVRCEGVMCVPRLANIVLLSIPPGEASMSEVSILEALVPAAIKLQTDSSASVRVSLAAAAGELLTLMVALQRRTSEHFINSFSSIEGRSANDSARKVDAESGKQYKRIVDEKLIPLVQKLLNDKDTEVTSAALRAVTNASRRSINTAPGHSHHRKISVASEDDSISLSSYQSHTSRENRQPVFLPVLSEMQVLRLLPTLAELAESRQWRVRQSAVEIVPALLGCTQKHETRLEISKLCIRLMGDSVDAVRKTAAECLCLGGSSLGSHGEDASAEWITMIVIPAIRTCAMDVRSKHRLLSLKMIEVLLLNGECPSQWKGEDSARMTSSPMRELASIALSLTNDRIANVRLNVGRVLEGVLDQFDEDELAFIREVLRQQLESEKEREDGGDRDVLYFANRCFQKASIVNDDQSLSQEILQS